MTGGYFTELRACLKRKGVPGAVAARLASELSDHADDAAGGEANGDAALGLFGRPDDFAASLVESYRANSFAWRHPVLSFGLVPVLSVIACLFSPVLLGVFCRFDDGISRIFWLHANLSRSEIMGYVSAYGLVLTFMATTVSGLALHWLMRRTLAPLRYQAAGYAILSLIGFMLIINFSMIPPLSPDRAFSFAYSIGLGFPTETPLLNLCAGLFPGFLFALNWRRLSRVKPSWGFFL